MPAAKALLFSATDVDGQWLKRSFEKRDWDAESVTEMAPFERAVHWWKPDVVIVSVDAGESRAIETTELLLARPNTSLYFLFGARPPTVMARLRNAYSADGAISTVDDLGNVVDEVLRAHAAHVARQLEGPGGFADSKVDDD